MKVLLDSTPIDELKKLLSTRARNALVDLRRWNQARQAYEPVELKTVGDVRRQPDMTFLIQPNFGRKSLKELREACGDSVPFDPAKHRLTMVEALGPEKAEIVIAMRSLASQMQRLANLIEEAGRKGAL